MSKKIKSDCCRRYRRKSEACKRCPLLHALPKKARKSRKKRKLRKRLVELEKRLAAAESSPLCPPRL